MEAVFIDLLNRSIAASWLILAVVLLRVVLRKAPKRILCVLWMLVALRLIWPFTWESAWSLLPSAETVKQDIALAQLPSIDSGIFWLDGALNPAIEGAFAPTPGDSMNPLQVWLWAASVIWVMGMAGMIAYAGISYVRLRRKVAASIALEENIRLCDEVDTPFILGVLRPQIFLPSNLQGGQTEYVLAHERAHLRRGDHWWKPLGFLLLSVYWFAPLCWLAYVLLCRDIELACDETVIRAYDLEHRKAYSRALLDYSVPHHKRMACPLAFGEVGVKERVKSVLNYKKPTFWMIMAAALACAAAAVCFLSDPKPASADWRICFPTQHYENPQNLPFYEMLNETQPFAVQLRCPEGWEIKNGLAPELEAHGTFLPMDLYDLRSIYMDGECIGYLGFCVFEPYEEEIPPEEYYKTVWPGLRLSSSCIWDPFVAVREDENGACGMAEITYYEERGGVKTECRTQGILAYDKELQVYTGIAFLPGKVQETELAALADSLTFTALS